MLSIVRIITRWSSLRILMCIVFVSITCCLFFGKCHVAYLPKGKIIGLSKVPRLIDAYSRRLQVQERLTTEIAQCINNIVKPDGVAVVIDAVHLCMSMRGVEKQNSYTTTSSMLGCFKDDARTRSEFLSLLAPSRTSK